MLYGKLVPDCMQSNMRILSQADQLCRTNEPTAYLMATLLSYYACKKVGMLVTVTLGHGNKSIRFTSSIDSTVP